MSPALKCGCESGLNCTRTTLCSCQAAVEDALEAQSNELELLRELYQLVFLSSESKYHKRAQQITEELANE